jgi:hypothetical protein
LDESESRKLEANNTPLASEIAQFQSLVKKQQEILEEKN